MTWSVTYMSLSCCPLRWSPGLRSDSYWALCPSIHFIIQFLSLFLEGLEVKEGDVSTPLVLACLAGCSQQILQLALALTH